MMHRTIFTIDGFVPAYIGYTNGTLWNGWSTPYFEVNEAIDIMNDYNNNAEYSMMYDADKDEFYAFDGDSDYYRWKGENIKTKDGIKHLYGIGAYCWVWDAVNDGDRRYIAQQAEELLNECRDQWFSPQHVENLIKQLQDLDTFYKVIQVIRNDELSTETKYKQLGELLTL